MIDISFICIMIIRNVYHTIPVKKQRFNIGSYSIVSEFKTRRNQHYCSYQ